MVNKKAIKNTAKKIGMGVAKTLLIPVEITHLVPTFFRKASEKIDDSGDAFMLPLIGGILCPVAYSAFTGSYLHSERGWEYPYFWIPAIVCTGTNIASGLYELYRYERNKLENPAIDSKPSSGLEGKVETPIVKPEEIVDPWKAELDEAKYLRAISQEQ